MSLRYLIKELNERLRYYQRKGENLRKSDKKSLIISTYKGKQY